MRPGRRLFEPCKHHALEPTVSQPILLTRAIPHVWRQPFASALRFPHVWPQPCVLRGLAGGGGSRLLAVSASQDRSLEPQRAAELLGRIEENVHRVIVGKERAVRLAITGLLGGGS